MGRNGVLWGRAGIQVQECAKVKLFDYLSPLKDAWGTFFLGGLSLEEDVKWRSTFLKILLNLFYYY